MLTFNYFFSNYTKYFILFIILLASECYALKFEIRSHPGPESKQYERCIQNFVMKDQLVVVTVKSDGERGDGQFLNMIIRDNLGNSYAKAKDIVYDNRYAFNALSHGFFEVCFENLERTPDGYFHHDPTKPYRYVELDINVGADAKDWSSVQSTEKLRPMELELRKIDAIIGEVVDEMDYLRSRELKLRDTNESTNERVKWFALSTMGVLVGLGAWQVLYLRAYFR